MKPKTQPSTDWTDPLRPLVDMATISVDAAQTMVKLQSDFMAYLLDMSYKQFSILADFKDPKRALEQQLECIKAIDSKWYDTAEQEIEAAREVQQSINGILKKNIQVPEFIEQLGKELHPH